MVTGKGSHGLCVGDVQRGWRLSTVQMNSENKKHFSSRKISHLLHIYSLIHRFRPSYSFWLDTHTHIYIEREVNLDHHTWLMMLVIINRLNLQLRDSSLGRIKGIMVPQLNQNRSHVLVCMGVILPQGSETDSSTYL